MCGQFFRQTYRNKVTWLHTFPPLCEQVPTRGISRCKICLGHIRTWKCFILLRSKSFWKTHGAPWRSVFLHLVANFLRRIEWLCHDMSIAWVIAIGSAASRAEFFETLTGRTLRQWQVCSRWKAMHLDSSVYTCAHVHMHVVPSGLLQWFETRDPAQQLAVCCLRESRRPQTLQCCWSLALIMPLSSVTRRAPTTRGVSYTYLEANLLSRLMDLTHESKWIISSALMTRHRFTLCCLFILLI